MRKISIKATQNTIEKEAVKEIVNITTGKTDANLTDVDIKNIVLTLAKMHGIEILKKG